MGVPVVTLRGRHHRGRVGTSLLKRVGLDDWVAADAEAYVEIAAGLARDSSLRAEFRTGSRERMAPLCDAGSFARDMETAYRSLWRDWCAAPSRPPSTVFEFDDGVRIKVPNSINMVTPYVLQEQGQWFEKEIHFVHEFLKPGMQALDIGANYGVYTLPMAKILGPEGALWAFEPTSTTAAYLSDSLADNGFDNVELIQAALSNRAGMAKLNLNPNSELNEITDSPASDFEEVTLRTLDECMEEFAWKQIDFVKLDAEGEEENILQGGRGFLRELSPLIMFELKHGNTFNVSLIECFASLNYDTYRYVHGLGFLVPFKTDEIPDSYELNLFGCKEDTANRLEKSGMLVTAAALNETQEPVPQDNWQSLFTAMPYYTRLYGDGISADVFAAGTDRDAYIEALKLFSSAQSKEHAPAKRYRALCGAVSLLSPIAKATKAPMTRLCSLARILGAAGFRGPEVLMLERLLEALKAQPSLRLDEPFLAACPRFDHVDPGADNMLKWFTAQVIEQLETQKTFSSFYAGESGRENLEMLSGTGFMSEAMERRISLIKRDWPR